MKNIRVFRNYTVFILSVLLICGCERTTNMLSPAPASESKPLHITMIYPSDCVGSTPYCDAFHSGVKAAEAALEITLTQVNGMDQDPVATETIFRNAAQNADLIITAGYQMGDTLARVAPEYPDVNFAIFDVVMDMSNVASVNYKANEGSFLVGAIAALKTESGKIGYIGGADVPLLQEFEAGYVAGIRAINPNAEVTIEYISEDATGFYQPERANELASAQYANGVDVIYAAAGGSGQGVLEAAQAAQKFIIWVDTNGNHLAPNIVLTSMTKEIATTVNRLIGETVAGDFMAGVHYFGVADGSVTYTVDEHNQSLFTDEIVATVEALKAKIISGEIVVPNEVSLPRQP